MKTTMKNSEGEPRNREVHTRPIEINLSIAKERNQIFEEIKQEWVNNTYNKFSIHATGERAPEQWFRAIHPNDIESRNRNESRGFCVRRFI